LYRYGCKIYKILRSMTRERKYYDFCTKLFGVVLLNLAKSNRCGFVHTYRLINGHGCMETDINPYKWAWFTKDAMTHYFLSTSPIYFVCNPIQVQPYKVYGWHDLVDPTQFQWYESIYTKFWKYFSKQNVTIVTYTLYTCWSLHNISC